MNKKKCIGTLAVIAVCAVIAAGLVTADRIFNKKPEYDYTSGFFSMDTYVSVYSKSDVTADIEDIFSRCNAALDCKNENAETARLNSAGSISCSEELINTVKDTLSLNEKYGALTDITVGSLTSLWNITDNINDIPELPDDKDIRTALESVGTENIVLNGDRITLENGAKLDFGAVGKGAATDVCLEYLKKNDCGKTIVSTGSSLLLYGADNFDVDIHSPEGGGSFAKVKTKYPFLSTSGGYERYFEAAGKTYCHIIDPRTGYPTETDLTTVTVFCDSGIEADFLSTMIFLDGSENIGKYLDSPDYKIFAADKNKRLYVSGGLEYEVLNEKYSKADNNT